MSSRSDEPPAGATFEWVGETVAADSLPGDDEAHSLPPVAEGVLIAGRYLDRGPLGRGGMGEVRRVYDKRLGRVSAMKIVRPDRNADPVVTDRFMREALTTAGLQHPGVVPVHDSGSLPDGRLWFTMKEVEGETFQAVLDRLYGEEGQQSDRRMGDPPGFRRMVDALLRACQTMAYAHDRGFVHRDLKPENLMLGRFGEVMVLDWGLGKLVAGEAGADGRAAPLGGAAGSVGRASTTLHGGVLGSPPYMAPEQARGDLDLVAAGADVYALGAVLYHLIAGRAPYLGPTGADIVAQVCAGPPVDLATAARGRRGTLDKELSSICAVAMARSPEDRYPDAGALAEALEAWLDGTRRREEAGVIVRAAAREQVGLERAREALDARRAGAHALLAGIASDAPESARHAAWAQLEEADATERELERAEAAVEVSLQSAVKLAPALPQAHAELAELYRRRLLVAEARHDNAGSARFEAMLRAHDRGEHASWLQAQGAVSLATDPPGARVELFRYVSRHRRLVPERVRDLGHTPLHAVEVPRGSLLLEVSAPGRRTVRIPLLVRRGEHLDHVPPGAKIPVTVRLPATDEIGDDQIYVPPGWSLMGGDDLALDPWPSMRVWVDGFVITRGHVTVGDWRAFLADLDAQGRSDEVEAGFPRLTPSSPLLWRRSGPGAFAPDGPQNHNVPFDDDRAPMTLISRRQCLAYAAWRAARDGLPWRLAHDLEWERAARGADGRLFPWGNHYVRGRCWSAETHTGTPRPMPTCSAEMDVSPFGVCDTSGGVRTVCGNPYTKVPQLASGGRLVVRPERWTEDCAFTMVRGGDFSSSPRLVRLATRFGGAKGGHWSGGGLRLVRPLVE